MEKDIKISPPPEDYLYDDVEMNEDVKANDQTRQKKDDDDDIYGDLEASVFSRSRRKSEEDNKGSSLKLKTAVTEQKRLKIKVKRLLKENRAYATNISSLYLTAKSEIDKKNFIIKQLQSRLQELATTRAKSSSISRKDFEDTLRKCQQAQVDSQSKVTLKEIKKTVEAMKASNLTKVPKNKKRFKFGNNMSVFLHRDQVPFKRDKVVEFPVNKVAVATASSRPSQDTIIIGKQTLS